MAIKYKIDVITALKEAGYSTYRIRKEKIFGEKTMQDFRNNQPVMSADCIEKLCQLLSCQPGDILEYIEERNE